MTPTTLREMLRDDHEEVRRAAAAACALKHDKQYLPDLIDLLADKNALVVDAAHASLKAITGADFGPETGSTDSERTKAILAWRTWMKTKHD
jgi:HEAT repeat protein